MLLCLVLLYNTLVTAGLCLLFPLLLPLIIARAKRRHTFLQRMGWHRYPWQLAGSHRKIRRIWVHALSVGEVLAAQPLVNKLSRSNSDTDVFLTTSTLTGFQTASRLFSHRHVHLAYFPYDIIWSVRSVANVIDPTHVIITETDIWPTFLWEMKRRNVPVYLVNLRISLRTERGYNRFKGLVRRVYAGFDRVCVQTRNEMAFLTGIGVSPESICITGNLKFDGVHISTGSDPAADWRNRLHLTTEHRIIVAGSTHEGEEAILFKALRPVLIKHPDVSLIVAPRDPRRGRAVSFQSRQYGLDSQMLSQKIKGNEKICPQVLVVDQLGVLKELYCLATVALVGGSLVPSGGHNPLEPAHWAKPILFGKDMRDFDVIADYLLSGGAALRIHNGDHLRSVVEALLNDPQLAAVMGKSALKVFLSHQGAVDRTLSCLNLG